MKQPQSHTSYTAYRNKHNLQSHILATAPPQDPSSQFKHFNHSNYMYAYPNVVQTCNHGYNADESYQKQSFNTEQKQLQIITDVMKSLNEFQEDRTNPNYKQKTFQFMKKTTNQKRNIKQYQYDIHHLETEVYKLTNLIKDILFILGITPTQKHFEQGIQGLQVYIEEIKTTLSSINKCKETNNNSTPQTSINSHIGNNDRTLVSCDCDINFSEIIEQYKSIMDRQHKNMVIKENEIKNLKKERKLVNVEYEQLVKEAQRYKEQAERQRKEIDMIEQQNKVLLERQQTHLKQLIYSKAMVDKVQTEMDEYDTNNQTLNQRCTYLQGQLKQKQKMLVQKQNIIQSLIQENQQLVIDKEEINNKYKEDIYGYENMSVLVEQKLIEVDFQMNYYKKERADNFQKINRLQQQLNQYRMQEQKQYYSFGHSSDVQVDLHHAHQQKQKNNHQQEEKGNNDDRESDIIQSYGQIIVSSDRTVTIKKKPDDQEGRDRKQKQQSAELQEQCYKESIRTLLNQNQRLKKSLYKLYQYQQGTNEKLEQQIELQIKMVIFTLNNGAENQATNT